MSKHFTKVLRTHERADYGTRALQLDVFRMLVHVNRNINRARKEAKTMADKDRAALDAAIAALEAKFLNLKTAVSKGFADLEAKIASGTVSTPDDFSAEISKLKALADNADDLATQAEAADPGDGTTSTGTTGDGTTTGTGTTTEPDPTTGTTAGVL